MAGIFNNNDNNNGAQGKRFRFNIYWMYALLLFGLLAYWMYGADGSSQSKEVTWTDFQTWVEKKGVSKIVVHANKNEAEAFLTPAMAKQVFGPNYHAQQGATPTIIATIPSSDKFEDKVDKWQQTGVFNGKIEYKNDSDFTNLLIAWGPLILLVVFWIWIMRGMGGRNGGGGVFNVGRSRAKLHVKDKDKSKEVTFADVAGMEKEKKEVSEIVEFLKNPKQYTDLGGTIPKGVLLVGPPGTGKTLLAKAVAGEAQVPFFSMAGSDFVEMFVGVGASRVRDMFREAKEKAPCIVFIDEIDAIGRARSRKNDFAANDERENTLNQLLTEMDGFGNNSGVIVLAATNRADVLDKALLRAGRFDRQIYIGNPSVQDRADIFKVHLRNVKIDGSVDLDKLARMTAGLSGADIANICNEAALLAARAKKKAVQQPDFYAAIDRVTRQLDKPTRMTDTVTFADVAGMEKPKKEVAEIISFLRNPKMFTRLGGKIPRGVLLVGPPGSGKTLLAKAVAGEAHVPFFSTSAAEFQGEFMGSGVSRVRELFRNAKEKAPCIIFIDEIDAIGSRSNRNGEREITLNQLLAEMDGYGTNNGVIVMGATNRVELIDKALVRPGRFDRKIYVGFPELKDREEIFNLYLKRITTDDSVDAKELARKASGFSGAEISNVCNDAAVQSAGAGHESVTQDDLLKSIEKVRKGLDYDTKLANTVTFDDIAGITKPKSKILQIVDFLKRPEHYTRLGGKIPRGVLLSGPTGTGKTLLAKAVANEADVPFITASGPDLANIYGDPIQRLHEIFREAREKSPCVVFIDEIEAIGAKRSEVAADQSRTPALSQLLIEMDGMGTNSGVIVMAACNNQDTLDKSLLRPGRLDRHIYVGQPNQQERVEIFSLYLKHVKLAHDVKIEDLAKKTSGFSGADISKVCNDAALAAASNDDDTAVSIKHFDEAIENLRKGLEDKHTEVGTITFDDVAGMDEAKHEVTEIVDFLKNPAKYGRLGGKVPKGALLVGPPGTGKTMLARAVAGEAQVPFFSRSGSEFVEKFVGVGASRVRELFNEAKEKAPCVVFIDEIDAVGAARSNEGFNSEHDQTLNQLLTEMDGIDGDAGVIVLAATNREDILDPALLRPGRFDRKVHVSLPALPDREAIFKVHLKKKVVDPSVDLNLLARQTTGMSGADIANVCNEAAIIAARRNAPAIAMQDFGEAIDKVTMGLENKSMLLTKQDKYETAVHEAGHTTVIWHLQYAQPLVKISIVPRGQALGVNLTMPEERVSVNKQGFLDEICTFMGGRAAEELFLGTIGAGALNDMQQATRIARNMVVYYGMSEKMPNISYYDPKGQMGSHPYSDERAHVIDEEISRIVNEQYQRAKAIISKYAEGHHKVVDELMDKEVIYAADVERIFGPRPWPSRTEELQKIAEERKRKADAERKAQEQAEMQRQAEEEKQRKAQEEAQRKDQEEEAQKQAQQQAATPSDDDSPATPPDEPSQEMPPKFDK